MNLAAIRITNSATTPPAEYSIVSRYFLFIAYPLSGTLTADNDASREQRETNHGSKEHHVAQIDHAPLKALKMRHNAERRNGLHERRIRPAHQQIGDRRKSREDQEQADHHRNDEADHLVARHRRGHAADREVSTGEHNAAEIAGDDHTVVRAAEPVDGDPYRNSQRQIGRAYV